MFKVTLNANDPNQSTHTRHKYSFYVSFLNCIIANVLTSSTEDSGDIQTSFKYMFAVSPHWFVSKPSERLTVRYQANILYLAKECREQVTFS
jgi:hypothetical protein